MPTVCAGQKLPVILFITEIYSVLIKDIFLCNYNRQKLFILYNRAKRIYEQMADPRVVIALGSCTITGGMYWDSYNTIKRLEDYIPVNMYVPGCPPRPEAIFEACEKIFEHVKEMD